MMLNIMCNILNHSHDVYMMCIRVMNPLVNMVGGVMPHPVLGFPTYNPSAVAKGIRVIV